MKNNINESRFEDSSISVWIAKERKPCYHEEHNPPGNIVVPSGQRYRHVCPTCGSTQIIQGDVMRG